MKQITKEFEIELKDGSVVNVSLTVEGVKDSHYGADADGNRGESVWSIESSSYETDEELTETGTAELEAQISELIDSEEWNFEDADDASYDDFDF